MKMLKTGRLEPPVTVGGSVEEVIGVLTLMVHPGRTRSQPLSPWTVHLNDQIGTRSSTMRMEWATLDWSETEDIGRNE